MKVHHVAITCNNLYETRKFYEDVFGFQCMQEFEKPSRGGKAIFLKLGEFHLELWEFKEVKNNKDDLQDLKIRGIKHLAFEVDNLKVIREQLHTKGLEVSEPKFGASEHWYSFIQDPNGVMLELYQI